MQMNFGREGRKLHMAMAKSSNTVLFDIIGTDGTSCNNLLVDQVRDIYEFFGEFLKNQPVIKSVTVTASEEDIERLKSDSRYKVTLT